MAFKKSSKRPMIFVGIRGSVAAVDKESGTIVWKVELRRGASFVPLVVEDDRVFAASGGELTCLDAATGALIWHNPLKGLGMGYAMLAGSVSPGIAAAVAEAEAAAAASAAH